MILLLIFSLVLVTSCANDVNDTNDINDDDQNNVTDPNTDNMDNNNANNGGTNQNTDRPGGQDNLDQDVDLTTMLLAEEEVADGQIYIREDWAIGAINLNDDVSQERAQEIAQLYAEQIQAKYTDKRVNVQVILRGENVANIEL